MTEIDEIIVALETRSTTKGRLRIRGKDGWVSELGGNNGAVLMALADTSSYTLPETTQLSITELTRVLSAESDPGVAELARVLSASHNVDIELHLRSQLTRLPQQE